MAVGQVSGNRRSCLLASTIRQTRCAVPAWKVGCECAGRAASRRVGSACRLGHVGAPIMLAQLVPAGRSREADQRGR